MPLKDLKKRKAYHKKYSREWEKRTNRWKNDPKRREQRNDYVLKNRKKIFDAVRLFLYGISPEVYRNKIRNQNNRCALCGALEKRKNYRTGRMLSLAVDHDHTTGKIRDLLCADCNRALGLFKDSIKLLLKAVRYLKKHKGIIQ